VITVNKKKRALFLTLLVPALLFLLSGESGAHVDMLNLSHNTPSHLVATVGRDACIAAVNTIRGINSKMADSIGLTAQGCRDAANSTSQSLQEAEQGVGGAAQEAIDCVSDPVGCIEQLAEESGVTDPNLTKKATLSGNISIDTGPVSMPEILASTGVQVVDMDASGVSIACRGIVEGWWRSIGVAEWAASITSGGGYALVVPACGPITYTVAPSNYLFTWSPPTRTVTVGAGGGSSSGGGGGGSISAGNMQRMEATGGAVQMQQQQSGSASGGSSGSSGRSSSGGARGSVNSAGKKQQSGGASGGAGTSGGQKRYYRSGRQ